MNIDPNKPQQYGPNNSIGIAILQTIVQSINQLAAKTNPPKIVDGGTVSNAKAAIYTAVSPEEEIKYLHLYHASATPQVVQIYLNVGGVSRQWSRTTVNQYGTMEAFAAPIFLNQGDAIEAETTTDAVVLFNIGGEIVTGIGV